MSHLSICYATKFVRRRYVFENAIHVCCATVKHEIMKKKLNKVPYVKREREREILNNGIERQLFKKKVRIIMLKVL